MEQQHFQELKHPSSEQQQQQQPATDPSIMELRVGHVGDDTEEEELDVIVSSWKRNFVYFQEEQAKRAVADAETIEGKDEHDDADTYVDNDDDDDDDTVEDSLLQGIMEEDCDYDEDDCSIVDDATMYTLATYEESDFQDFVRRQQEQQIPKSFTERFLEALGMRDDDDETVVSIGTRATAQHFPTLATLPEEEEEPNPGTPSSASSAAAVYHKEYDSREGKGQREPVAMELPLDVPPIPMFDTPHVEIELQPSRIARKEKRRKKKWFGGDDDASLSPSVLSRTMTM
ncbi:MAG: hypothetical protein SGILL_002208 [Bacillariaceae sp.]